MSSVVVFLADGFEEVEAVTPIDYLRRAGADVSVLGVGTRTPLGSRGVSVSADALLEHGGPVPDCVLLPGGMPGAANLSESAEVRDLCERVMAAGGLVAAICAAPAAALGKFGLLDGRRYTCYPGFEESVPTGTFQSARVVRDGNLITAGGPGAAEEFALELIDYLFGGETARTVGQGILARDFWPAAE